VGQRLRALREQADMTLAELSEATGVTISAIHRLESGHNVRLTTYFPLWCFFAERDPQAWMLAEAIVLLPAAERAKLVGLVDPSDG
jgi:transcriptional regulator with XRE-family HTH domain